MLESILVPAIVSGLIVFPTRWFDHRVFLVPAYATAFFLAIAASYLLIFGWPTISAPGARQKVFFATLAGAVLGAGIALGMNHGLGRRRAFHLLSLLAIAAPLWIGWPALMQGAASIFLLALPVGLGLWILHAAVQAPERTIELGLLLVITATGLAWIALFARTFSMAQLSLALAAALLVSVFAGRKPPEAVILITAATMLFGLLSTVMLYSEASSGALLILCSALALPILTSFIRHDSAWPNRLLPSLLIASVLTVIAVAIAWIDAGAKSVYEGAHLEGTIVGAFVQ